MKPIEFTEFTLDGDPQVYKLAYDFNAICDAELETKENLQQYLFAIGKPSSIFLTALQHRAVLYALLKTAHPQVLLKEAGELLSRDTQKVSETMMRALGIDPAGEGATEDSEPAK